MNSPNAFNEVGSIHTTQGYDLNYTGVIFGEEIIYNKISNEIEINKDKYFDKYGKQQATEEDLKAYIINIYKTIMYRAIKGTFIYACDKNLREYFKEHITTYTTSKTLRILPFEDVKPYVNAVPFIDIYVAAGDFSDLQVHENLNWVELPMNITVRENYFVCKVVGESMNKQIPSNSYCLFTSDVVGSREGKIVLAEHYNIQDSEFGAGYTVKEYHSTKELNENKQLRHSSITLKPLSNKDDYEDIEIIKDDLARFKVVGLFVCVL